MLNLDKTTRLQFAMIDRVSESNAATLTAIATAIGAVQAAKDGAKAANEDKAANIPTIWDGVLNIVEAVTNDEAAKDLPVAACVWAPQATLVSFMRRMNGR